MKRRLDQNVLDGLLQSSLWNNKLKADCEKREVMLTIRDNRIDFYHKGGKLFSYDKKGFQTHVKYASVIESKKGHDSYMYDSELRDCKIISNFKEGYDRIKENCKMYGRTEAEGVSGLCQSHSYVTDKDIVVLDIEISFEAIETDRKQDRIDMLLFNKKTQNLKFVEAKHFSNNDIWSEEGKRVIDQIQRYNEQIIKERHNILSEYNNYIDIVNQVFRTNIPDPKEVEEDVTLLIFGFDQSQKTGKLAKHLKKNVFDDIHIRAIGKIDHEKDLISCFKKIRRK